MIELLEITNTINKSIRSFALRVLAFRIYFQAGSLADGLAQIIFSMFALRTCICIAIEEHGRLAELSLANRNFENGLGHS
jgi:hypothetical protein